MFEVIASNKRRSIALVIGFVLVVVLIGTAIGYVTGFGWVGTLVATLIAGVFAFAPFGVAWLMGRYDLERLLWGGIGLAIVALLASGLLLESRVRIRTSPGSWRFRQRTARTA